MSMTMANMLDQYNFLHSKRPELMDFLVRQPTDTHIGFLYGLPARENPENYSEFGLYKTLLDNVSAIIFGEHDYSWHPEYGVVSSTMYSESDLKSLVFAQDIIEIYAGKLL